MYLPVFHKKLENFHVRQNTDILKTTLPINLNYFVIRISYKDIQNLHLHILEGLNRVNDDNPVYFSNKEDYQFMNLF
jgi:hypothetical protein